MAKTPFTMVITRNNRPMVLIVNVEGIDEEQMQLGSSNKFWQLITARRKQSVINRTQLEHKVNYLSQN